MTNHFDYLDMDMDPAQFVGQPRHVLVERLRAKQVYERRKSKQLCEESLSEFIKQAWHIVEPANPYVGNWHIDFIARHLEAITYGEITRLLINVPPGAMKSLLTNVFWPAWEWTQNPSLRYICTAHSQNLAIRDSIKMRRLITSDWYRERWGDVVKLTADQSAKTKFENTATGFREAVAFESMTGVRGDRVTIDDPHSVDSALSDVQRESTINTFLEAVPTRLTNPKESAIVVIMQRLHTDDVSGVILEKNLGYEHIMLPMRFDPSRRCVTSLGFEDLRQEEGELLFPARFPAEVVTRDEEIMGPWACNTGEAPVLMADLSLKRIDEIVKGDKIIGWSRKNNSRSKAQYTIVKEVYKYRAPVVKMTLDSGEIIRCTPDHKWWRARWEEGRNEYAPAKIGTSLARVCPSTLPQLSVEDERLAGWLAGFFDGEGSVSVCKKDGKGNYNPSRQIHFYQGAGRNLPLCEKLEHALDRFGFDYNYIEDIRKPNKNAPCYGYRAYTLLSNQHSLGLAQKFLHIVKPIKWRDRIEAMAEGSKFVKQWEKVISIEPDGEDDVYALTTETGNYVVWGLASSNSAGQFQQTPSPRGGGIVKREWWALWDDEMAQANGLAGAHKYPPMDYVIASLDPAYTEKKENDPSALTVWGIWQRGGQSARRILSRDGEIADLIDDRDTIPSLMMMYSWERRLHIHGTDVERMAGESDFMFNNRKKEAMGLVEHVIETCNKYNVDMLLIEAKGPGLSVAQEIKRLNRTNAWGVELVNPGNLDKVARAYAVQPIFANGAVFAPDKDWADKVISQWETFPKCKHDDLVDSTTQALKYLRERNMIRRPEELIVEIRNEGAYRSQTKPVYDV
jgi:predicted phage terminase large subunit-like protein